MTEYVATDSIEENYYRLLDIMDKSMSGDEVVDTSAWVSGFYGSGKSSFTKYLGFALDPSKRIGGRSFLDYFVDQFPKQTTKQKLKTVANKHPLTVIMIDLASNQLAGAQLVNISSVLYWQVMQWAGYSRERKIAYLEFMLERDGKREQFEKRYSELAGGKKWAQIQSNPLVAATYAAKLACEFYPEHWKDPTDFQRVKLDEANFEEPRVSEMLDIIKRRSGKEKIIFILDEVGQYITGTGSDDRILNLDGLAKNIKNLGRGKVWIVATAQQTLTEDSPQAQVNSPKLFKLKDRFPVTIDLEASDIRTICHRRLLSKSKEARLELGKLFDQYGQKIIHATKLEQAKVITSSISKELFIDLYPFLPQHLDLLLILLGRLAKTSGGIGLRSAIKSGSGRSPWMQEPEGTLRSRTQKTGQLANAVIFYDCLRKDIQRSFPHLVQGVDKAVSAFGADSLEGRLAKAVGVLQVTRRFPAYGGECRCAHVSFGGSGTAFRGCPPSSEEIARSAAHPARRSRRKTAVHESGRGRPQQEASGPPAVYERGEGRLCSCSEGPVLSQTYFQNGFGKERRLRNQARRRKRMVSRPGRQRRNPDKCHSPEGSAL